MLAAGAIVWFAVSRGLRPISELQEAIDNTRHNKRMQLTLALSYSGRWELVRAIKELVSKARQGLITETDINEFFAESKSMPAFLFAPSLTNIRCKTGTLQAFELVGTFSCVFTLFGQLILGFSADGPILINARGCLFGKFSD